MRQFINGSDDAFADLERRARTSCVTFQNQPMPPGANPGNARVGFEVSSRDQSATLFVDRGIRYSGGHTSVQRWLQAGELRCPSFRDLKAWIRNELGPCYGGSVSGHPQAELQQASIAAAPADLTDLGVIRDELEGLTRQIFLDEDLLFSELQTHVRGQDPALLTLSRRVCRHIARAQPARPATLFATGPTGCGKTKTAEVLPAVLRSLSGDKASYGYLRLDMSEYKERHRVSQLLGAPQGYIGYGDGARLIDTLVANPMTIVLFDEIEKAHPDVFQTLMNAMDAGRLSSPTRTVDCRKAIFLFTSNVVSADILRDLEQSGGFEQQSTVDEVCRRNLRAAGIVPELLGRINAFLVYRSLSSEARAEIAAQAIFRVAAEYGVNVARIEPEVVLAILKQSQSENYGARPDEYLVDDLLGSVFSEAAADNVSASVRVTGGPPFACEVME